MVGITINLSKPRWNKKVDFEEEPSQHQKSSIKNRTSKTFGYLRPISIDHMEKNDNQLNIELSEELAEGIYSNLAIITHSQAEFVTDFIQMMPGMPKAKVRSRVIMSPQNAKRLMRALSENIQKYEQANGVIVDTESTPFPPMNFGGPATQA